ncbi:uncharacterized protein KZ484_020465 [Pholidichthys leucotaenia]
MRKTGMEWAFSDFRLFWEVLGEPPVPWARWYVAFLVALNLGELKKQRARAILVQNLSVEGQRILDTLGVADSYEDVVELMVCYFRATENGIIRLLPTEQCVYGDLVCSPACCSTSKQPSFSARSDPSTQPIWQFRLLVPLLCWVLCWSPPISHVAANGAVRRQGFGVLASLLLHLKAAFLLCLVRPNHPIHPAVPPAGSSPLLGSVLVSSYLPQPVSPADLTVDHVSSSSHSCILTVTCSTGDSHISSNFTCDTRTCYQEGGEKPKVTASGAVLHLQLANQSIICNHSNQVSYEETPRNIRDLFPNHADPTDGVSICHLKMAVFSVGLIIMVSAVITVYIVEKIKKQKQLFSVNPFVFIVSYFNYNPPSKPSPQKLHLAHRYLEPLEQVQ